MIRMLPRTRAHLRRRWLDLIATPTSPERQRFWRSVRAQHPPFMVAVAEDARITAARRGERHAYRSPADTVVQALRLMLVTESFFAQCCYRGKARCQGIGIPLLPRILNHLAVTTGRIAIGDPVIVEPGLFIPHGQVCVDGIVTIGGGTVIAPFTTVGLRSGDFIGPTIGKGVAIGAGACVLGPCVIGEGATIGANAVVTTDVPAGATAVGAPTRVRRPT